MVTEWAPLKPNESMNYSATFSTLRIQGVLQVGHGLRFKEDHGVATGYLRKGKVWSTDQTLIRNKI